MNKTNIKKIIEILKDSYPDAKCSLDFASPFELVVAVMLSAQCTDERVNLTTPNIFSRYSSPESFASADLSELEKLIHPCGFYRTKAKNIKACAQKIVTDFHGEVPHSMEKLTSLPGIGRKSANVVLLEAFHIPYGIAVDTHAKRVSNRLGLSTEKEPEKIEQDLLRIVPKKFIQDINHLFVWHGRNCCTARNPKCNACPVQNLCHKNL